MANGLASGNLAERGITGETVQKYGIEIDSNPTSECFHNRLGFDALREGKLADLVREAIWFPCRDADGKIVVRIARLLPAIGEIKILNPKGGAQRFRPRKHHQHVSEGDAKIQLRFLIAEATGAMASFREWDEFHARWDSLHPQINQLQREIEFQFSDAQQILFALS